MHPLSDHDRRCVEVTTRLLRASAAVLQALPDSDADICERVQRSAIQAAYRQAVDALALLLAERTPKAPPEPGVPPPDPST